MRPATLFLTYWLLKSMPDYSATLPSGETPGKVWRRTEPYGAKLKDPKAKHYVGMYGGTWEDQSVPIYWFRVVIIEGPERPGLEGTDWSRQGEWSRYHRSIRSSV